MLLGAPGEGHATGASKVTGRHRATRGTTSASGRHRAPRVHRRASRYAAGATVTSFLVAAVGYLTATTQSGATSADPPSPAITQTSIGPTTFPSERSNDVSRAASRTDVTVQPDRIRQQNPATRLPFEPPPWLASCAAPPAAGSAANGALPEPALCHLPNTSHVLIKPAAQAWSKLSRQYAIKFGEKPCITDSYRSLSAQEALRRAKPGLAAQPGTSNHGWGTALDLCGGAETFGSDVQGWLMANGPRWDWTIPDWAREQGSKPEPWHWEYAEG